MKKVLLVLVIILVSAFLGWQVSHWTQPARSDVLEVQLRLDSSDLSPVPTLAPVAPVSEVDQKLRDLGFGSVAKAHKISVSK